MLKRLSITLGALVAALALAAGTTEGARGKGNAMSADNKPSQFRFEAMKHDDGTRVHVGGHFHFDSGNPAVPASRFRVEGQVMRIQVNENATAASFGGHGFKAFQRNGTLVRVPGMFRVNVVDGRNRDNTSGQDTISVEFVPRDTAQAATGFQYQGTVGQGDVAVMRRTQP